MHLDVENYIGVKEAVWHSGMVPSLPIAALSALHKGYYFANSHNHLSISSDLHLGNPVALTMVSVHQGRSRLKRTRQTLGALLDRLFTMALGSPTKALYASQYPEGLPINQWTSGRLRFLISRLPRNSASEALKSLFQISPFLDGNNTKRYIMQESVYCQGCDTHYSLLDKNVEPPCRSNRPFASEGTPFRDCRGYPYIIVPDVYLPRPTTQDMGYRFWKNCEHPFLQFRSSLSDPSVLVKNALLAFRHVNMRTKDLFFDCGRFYAQPGTKGWSLSYHFATELSFRLPLPDALLAVLFSYIKVVKSGISVPFPSMGVTKAFQSNQARTVLAGRFSGGTMKYDIHLVRVNSLRFKSAMPPLDPQYHFSGQWDARFDQLPILPRFVVSNFDGMFTVWAFGSTKKGVEASFTTGVDHGRDEEQGPVARSGLILLTRETLSRDTAVFDSLEDYVTGPLLPRRVLPISEILPTGSLLGHFSTPEESELEDYATRWGRTTQCKQIDDRYHYLDKQAYLSTTTETTAAFPRDKTLYDNNIMGERESSFSTTI